jgi:hypothetical protein
VSDSHPLRLLLCVLLSLFLACCATGVGEFETYRSSFEKTYSTSTAILDQLAVQERALFVRRHPAGSSLANATFDPAQATYYSDAADPPGTAAFRRALNTVKAYNDLLYGLETGQTAATLTSKVAALESQATSTITAATGLIGIPQFKAVGVAINSAFAEVQPFLQLGLTFRSQEEFRAYVQRYYPAVRALLLELRHGTTAIFPVLTAAINRKSFDPSGGPSSDDIKKIEGYRKLLSDWVIMIDASIKGLDEAKAAVDAPPTILGTITGVTSASLELETAVQAARKHIAELAAK